MLRSNCSNVPIEWRSIASLDNKKTLNFTSTAFDFLHAIYAVGKTRIHKIQIFKKNKFVYLSLYGKFSIKDNLIKASLREVIINQKSFFNDNNFPFYLISILENKKPNASKGTNLKNNFIAEISRDFDYTQFYSLFIHDNNAYRAGLRDGDIIQGWD